MEAINELELRRMLLLGLEPEEQRRAAIKHIKDPLLPWDEKRPFWMFLAAIGAEHTLIELMSDCLKARQRVPYDIVIDLSAKAEVAPTPLVVAALLKAIRKQEAQDDLVAVRDWDALDGRFELTRAELEKQNAESERAYRENLLEKFQYLRNQRMTEPAGRLLRRMVELFPADEEFAGLKRDFDEHWAREVVANFQVTPARAFERTRPDRTLVEEEMLESFLKAGEQTLLEKREVAADLSLAFWFMGDYARGLTLLNYAPPSPANDWLKAEMLLEARHFIEGLEWLNRLEVKYAGDPESTFAVLYLRAQCLRGSGQTDAALDILQSLVRVRPNYRATNALLQDWLEGANWE